MTSFVTAGEGSEGVLNETSHASVDHSGISAGIQAQVNAGAIQGAQPTLNMVSGSNVTMTATENPGQNRTDITVNSGVRGRANAGSTSGLQGTIRMIQGANISIGLLESGGELQFTITSTSAGLQVQNRHSGYWTWSNDSGARSSGSIGFTPKVAFAFGAFRQGATSVSHITSGWITATNQAGSCGQNAEGSSDGNDDSSTYANGSIAGTSNLGGIMLGGWTQAAINCSSFSSSNITLNPSTLVTGGLSMVILG